MELAEIDFGDVEAMVGEAGAELRQAGTYNDVLSDVDDAAAEVRGLRLGDGDAAVSGVDGFDLLQGCGVEGGGIVEQVSAGKGGEADIEVIEARIDEVKGRDGRVPGGGDVAMAVLAGADAVGGPEVRSGAIEERIAFAFEGGLTGRFPDEESGLLEPCAEVVFLGLTLSVGEAGDGGYAMVDERGVGDKDHVGGAGAGLEDADIGDSAKSVIEGSPLGKGAVAGGAMEIAGHPGIDDVVDVIPDWRAH